MFVGHTAVALAAKARVPQVSLGWWVAAAFALDLLWPIFLLIGIERVTITPGATAFTPLVFDSYPWSHSLVMTCVWGLGAAGIARFRGCSRGVAALLAAVVVSHWVLDFVTHRPDMPLWPGGPKVGLELWASVPGTLIVEGLLFGAGVAIYARATRARDAVGRYAFWGLVLLLLGLYVASLFSPPPPPGKEFAVVGLILTVVFVGLGVWVDRHREASSGSAAA